MSYPMDSEKNGHNSEDSEVHSSRYFVLYLVQDSDIALAKTLNSFSDNTNKSIKLIKVN
uniref:Uncharacterized protein n=1 Tax=Oryza brachyantha TaxID=4533 RepID=J3LDA8_ORYBR